MANTTGLYARTANHDIELGGKHIKKGDQILMWYASGNRDDAVFEDPIVWTLSGQTRASTCPLALVYTAAWAIVWQNCSCVFSGKSCCSGLKN